MDNHGVGDGGLCWNGKRGWILVEIVGDCLKGKRVILLLRFNIDRDGINRRSSMSMCTSIEYRMSDVRVD